MLLYVPWTETRKCDLPITSIIGRHYTGVALGDFSFPVFPPSVLVITEIYLDFVFFDVGENLVC